MDLRIDKPHCQHRVSGRQDLAILRIASSRFKTDIVLSVSAAFELEFVELRVVRRMHHHAVGRPSCNRVRQAALRPGLAFSPLSVLLNVKRGNSPLSDQALPRDGAWRAWPSPKRNVRG